MRGQIPGLVILFQVGQQRLDQRRALARILGPGQPGGQYLPHRRFVNGRNPAPFDHHLAVDQDRIHLIGRSPVEQQRQRIDLRGHPWPGHPLQIEQDHIGLVAGGQGPAPVRRPKQGRPAVRGQPEDIRRGRRGACQPRGAV